MPCNPKLINFVIDPGGGHKATLPNGSIVFGHEAHEKLAFSVKAYVPHFYTCNKHIKADLKPKPVYGSMPPNVRAAVNAEPPDIKIKIPAPTMQMSLFNDSSENDSTEYVRMAFNA